MLPFVYFQLNISYYLFNLLPLFHFPFSLLSYRENVSPLAKVAFDIPALDRCCSIDKDVCFPFITD